ncbi:MAG: PEP-CTERM sorting domain-containing protein [Spartobacteria bacterium]|nr:PEP-CTERM sorting domain-containing protein [Spartobacteria bacterium]
MKSVFTDGCAGYAKNFAAGALIGGTTGLSAWNQTQTLFTFSGKSANFNPVKTNLNFNGTTASTGYIGFKSGSNYGWAKVEVLGGGSYRINGWAYEDSGASILAGDQGGGGGSSVPEPSGLALLACGAAGIYALRRKRKTDTA